MQGKVQIVGESSNVVCCSVSEAGCNVTIVRKCRCRGVEISRGRRFVDEKKEEKEEKEKGERIGKHDESSRKGWKHDAPISTVHLLRTEQLRLNLYLRVSGI